MTIRKSEAEAAVRAVASALFSNIRQNQHTMEKHFSKDKAKAAADESHFPQGYFKKTGTKVIEKAADVNKLSANKQSALFKSLGTNKKGFNAVHKKMTEQFDRISVTLTSAAKEEDILPIVSQVLNRCELYSTRDSSNERFLAVAPMPVGFVGRAIEGDGTKHRDCNHAVVVINAGTGANPQIVTVFPATETYAKQTTLLA